MNDGILVEQPRKRPQGRLAVTEPEATELTARLQRVLARLGRLLRREAPSALGPGALSALSTLAAEGPMRPTDLAAREGVRPPTLTRMLTSLEEGGYVERANDPADRRASLIAVTPLGRKTLDDTRAARANQLARHLAELSPAQRRAIANALPALEALADTGETRPSA
jgi:DNA-binding MarR family transcriptional regulator